MKNRTIPFGYEIIDGKTVLNPCEAAVVRQIFEDYANGKSLKTIADGLKDQQVEYLAGQYAWNKNRIGRMLEDRRYVGTADIPPIITEERFQEAVANRTIQNTQRAYNKSEVITAAVVPIVCGKCGGAAKRLNVKTSTYYQKHVCTNPGCRYEYLITDKRLNEMILALLLAADIQVPAQATTSMEIRRMEKEIERQLESSDADTQALREMILDVAAEKYRLLTAGLEITDKLRTDLDPARLSSCNIRKTVMETVKQITLISSDAIELTLINGQVLRKERDDESDSIRENCPNNPTDSFSGTAAGIA